MTGHGANSSYAEFESHNWHAGFPTEVGGPEQTLAGLDSHLMSPTGLTRWSPLDLEDATRQEWQLPDVELQSPCTSYLDLRALEMAFFDTLPAVEGESSISTSRGNEDGEAAEGRRSMTVDNWTRWIAKFDHSGVFTAALSQFSESERSLLESTTLQGVPFARAVRVHLV